MLQIYVIGPHTKSLRLVVSHHRLKPPVDGLSGSGFHDNEAWCTAAWNTVWFSMMKRVCVCVCVRLPCITFTITFIPKISLGMGNKNTSCCGMELKWACLYISTCCSLTGPCRSPWQQHASSLLTMSDPLYCHPPMTLSLSLYPYLSPSLWYIMSVYREQPHADPSGSRLWRLC